MLLWLDCFSGISGDMLLGALVDAGLDLDALRAGLATLPLSGYALAATRVTEHGISGARLHVRLDESTSHEHRRLADITALLDTASLPQRAYERALAIFRRLAEAEAVIHGTTPDEVTFHEVGAVDSIVDIVGVALALELLDIAEIYCSELPLTSGRVRSAHGALPVPAPATLRTAAGTSAPSGAPSPQRASLSRRREPRWWRRLPASSARQCGSAPWATALARAICPGPTACAAACRQRRPRRAAEQAERRRVRAG